MYGRAGLDRFKKAQTLEPFSVDVHSSQSQSQSKSKQVSSSAAAKQPPVSQFHSYRQQQQPHLVVDVQSSTTAAATSSSSPATQLGGSKSNWQPPDWAIEPLPGVYYLEVLKDGDILDRIPLHKRRHIFGRQFHTCDFVLDHQSVSRQHAAVIPHKNGSIYVIDLGSAHGTFVANERLAKDTPVELEVGQSLCFAASTRTYILRKNEAALFPPSLSPNEIDLPPPPDPSDEDALVAYNTLLNRYGITTKSQLSTSSTTRAHVNGIATPNSDASQPSLNQPQSQPQPERPPNKKLRKTRVAFRDQVGGELVQVVGISDGADVETEPGPLGFKEGSLVGKYESLVQITVIPKGKGLEHPSVKEDNVPQTGVTDKLKQVLNKVKNTHSSKTGIYDDLYGETFSGKVGSSWAYPSATSSATELSPSNSSARVVINPPNSAPGNSKNQADHEDDDDDLFGD